MKTLPPIPFRLVPLNIPVPEVRELPPDEGWALWDATVRMADTGRWQDTMPSSLDARADLLGGEVPV